VESSTDNFILHIRPDVNIKSEEFHMYSVIFVSQDFYNMTQIIK